MCILCKAEKTGGYNESQVCGMGLSFKRTYMMSDIIKLCFLLKLLQANFVENNQNSCLDLIFQSASSEIKPWGSQGYF